MTIRMTAEAGATAAIRGLLSAMLERGVVDGVLVQVVEPVAGRLTHALITDPTRLEAAQPLSPDMPVNAARMVARLSKRHPSRKLAVVLRPCEERALVELVKLRQATLEHVYPVVFDCPGALTREEIARVSGGPDGLEGGVALGYATAHEPESPGPELLPGCRICLDFVPGSVADLSIELFGHPGWLGLRLSDRLAAAFDLAELGLAEADDEGERADVVRLLAGVRRRRLDRELGRIAGLETDVRALAAEVAECIRCGACRQACPICFCRRCTFDTPTFEREPDDYLRLADGRGALRMPDDVMLFHLTRLAHVAMSCAACGACEAVCPRGIALTRLFARVAPRVRAPFDYHPGRCVDDSLPLATFEREELEPR